MRYKVGDKVKVIKTDFPTNIPINSIKEVISVSSDSVELSNGRTNGWIFSFHEVEPYNEEIVTNMQNIHNLELGDNVGGDIIKEVTSVGVYFKRNNFHFKFSEINQLIEEAKDYPKSTFHLIKNNKVKELLGYKLKDKQYQKAVEAITGHSFDFFNCKDSLGGVYYAVRDKPVTGCYTSLKAAGVLDLWFEPVYKTEEVVVKLSGNRTATITSKTSGTITMRSDVAYITAKDITSAFDALNKLGQIAGYNVGIKEFNLGCQTFTIEDLVAVNKAFTDFK